MLIQHPVRRRVSETFNTFRVCENLHPQQRDTALHMIQPVKSKMFTIFGAIYVSVKQVSGWGMG